MFNISTLSEEDKTAIHSWAEQGADLQEIQKRMTSDLGHSITYLDTRFLVSDLGIDLSKPEVVESESEPELQEEELGEESIAPVPAAEAEPVLDGGFADNVDDVIVSMDEIAIPGALMSGKVSFSDGQAGRWYLDQTGRLGIDPDLSGYQPTEKDLEIFKEKLMKLAR